MRPKPADLFTSRSALAPWRILFLTGHCKRANLFLLHECEFGGECLAAWNGDLYAGGFLGLFSVNRWNRRLSSLGLEASAHLVLRRCIEVHCLAPLIADADIPSRKGGGAPVCVMIFQLKDRLIS